MKTMCLALLIVIILCGWMFALDKFDDKIMEEKKQMALQPTDFTYVKTLKYMHYYHNNLQEIQIQRDNSTGVLYMFYYGAKGISISRYYEKE